VRRLKVWRRRLPDAHARDEAHTRAFDLEHSDVLLALGLPAQEAGELEVEMGIASRDRRNPAPPENPETLYPQASRHKSASSASSCAWTPGRTSMATESRLE
jgi:hypothetical protein